MLVHGVEWLLYISSTINYQSRICVAGSLGQHKYNWNLRVCTARNKSLLDGILKIFASNNSRSQADLTLGFVKKKYLNIGGNQYTLSLLSLWSWNYMTFQEIRKSVGRKSEFLLGFLGQQWYFDDSLIHYLISQGNYWQVTISRRKQSFAIFS